MNKQGERPKSAVPRFKKVKFFKYAKGHFSSILQRQKIPETIRMTQKPLFPQLETAKTHLAQPKTSQKREN